ncbi:MAG: signal peptidase I [Planctomycetes bacterium]|nr:signal peptidase I [Planctomycetota bacterium]
MNPETTNSETTRRIPWVAVALSFLSAGVGHIYCGRIFKGLLLYFAWFVIPLAVSIGALFQASLGTLIGLILVPSVVVTILYFYAASDAFSIAKASEPSYRLKDYNRPAIYWLLILVEIVYPVGLTIGAREYVFEAFYLPAKSMAPSFLPGDRVLVNKLASRKEFPERGDVIVFRNPQPTGGRVFIKRVIGVAGDRLLINGDIVEVNGKQLERERVPTESLDAVRYQIAGDVYHESQSGTRYQVMYGARNSGENTPESREVVVPPRSVFVMGDNRNLSRDSRHFGAIHVGDMLGYVDYIFWPAESWSRFGVYRD